MTLIDHVNLQIISRGELNLWIAAFTQWKILEVILQNPDALNTSVPSPTLISKMLGSDASLTVLKAKIQMTLSHDRMTTLYGNNISDRRINEDLLLEKAFETKEYMITLRHGHFPTQKTREKKPTLHAFEIAFDKSPMPAQDEWRPEQAAMVESMRQYEMTSFCAQKRDGSGDAEGCIIV